MFYLDSSLGHVYGFPHGLHHNHRGYTPGSLTAKAPEKMVEKTNYFPVVDAPMKTKMTGWNITIFYKMIHLHSWLGFPVSCQFSGVVSNFFQGPVTCKTSGVSGGKGIESLGFMGTKGLPLQGFHKQTVQQFGDEKTDEQSEKLVILEKHPKLHDLYMHICIYIYILCCSVVQKGNSCRNMFKYV